MNNLFIIKTKSLATFSDSSIIYWKDLDGHWTRERSYARQLPEEIAAKLVEYLRWEGVEAVIEKY